MTPADDDLRRLQEIRIRFEQVLHREAWDDLKAVDSALRELLIDLRRREALPDEVLAACRDVQQIHGLALQRCQEECQRLRILMNHSEQPVDGLSAYAWVESLR